jgi:hypothetical protein
MQSTFNEGFLSYLAGEALEAYRRVKIKSGTAASPPEVVYADAGEAFIGVTTRPAPSGGVVAVKGPNDAGSFLLCAANSLAVGAVLYGAADGKVSDTVSGSPQFMARMAATGDGHVIEGVVAWFGES